MEAQQRSDSSPGRRREVEAQAAVAEEASSWHRSRAESSSWRLPSERQVGKVAAREGRFAAPLNFVKAGSSHSTRLGIDFVLPQISTDRPCRCEQDPFHNSVKEQPAE